MRNKKSVLLIFTFALILAGIYWANAVNLNPSVKDDPLIRMPGTQHDQGVNIEGPGRCLNCHGDYNEAVEPGYNWKGSMMAQSARDPIFWACLTVAAQDSHWAVGTPNAVDICERCHFPKGWLGGRSEPPNASAMTGTDYDGIHCDFCHRMWDPFNETTYSGAREGSDWMGYWDEATTLSQNEADNTYQEDKSLAPAITLLNGNPFYSNNVPFSANYTENAGGQYFVSTSNQKRASFADANAKHKMLYSRYHKSKYLCGTCHDVSNPVLANLGQDGTQPLTTETDSAFSYYHVERTFSEFMLSDYGLQGGAPTNPEFQAQGASDIIHAAKCQDCHMRDVVGVGCNKSGTPIRPDQSTEHPNSGQPLHDMTGGNAWISHILASLDPNGPVYDPVNADLLDQGPAVLTLDLNAGETPKQNGAALMAGSDRAKEQLLLAATIKNVNYNASNGSLSFTVQNNSAHKLISGFPEGRRIFVNVGFYSSGNLIFEVNPYDYTNGTLKGLNYNYQPDPDLEMPEALYPATEAYVDELVYETHPSSNLTGEDETFHFALATDRYKDNRIPPKGFRINESLARFCQPRWHGTDAEDYFTSAEYAGGYDDVNLTDYGVSVTGADYVEINLYYQTTSREYMEFLRDEINANPSNLTLPAEGYILQTDSFFSQLKFWGNTIWSLWKHNMNVDGAKPFLMTQGTAGAPPTPCEAPIPTLLSTTPGNAQATLSWSDEHTADPNVIGYKVYYDQAGKSQFIADAGLTTTYTDTGLTNGQEYCYKVTSYYDPDCESGFSNILCAIPNNQGQAQIGVNSMETGKYEKTGKGKNQTTIFVLTDTFSSGDTVVIRAYVIDISTGLPVQNALVDMDVRNSSGSVVKSFVDVASDADGIAEAQWQTQAPNKKGQGGTPADTYTATTIDVTADGYAWDGVMTSTTFTIQ